MDKPEEPPPAEPGEPRASRFTTIVLIVSLVVVVVVCGVLGTIAVLMTKSPDAPLLGAVPPTRLTTPIHFAPVKDTKPYPCVGEAAAVDQKQTTCYLLEDGVTVNAVQRIEPVREKDGTYSVRIAIAPVFKDKVSQLIDELVADQRQVAVVQLPKTVVAAPIVTQVMDGDSLSITGFDQADAEALTASLLGSTASPGPQTPASTGSNPASQPLPTGPASNPAASNPAATTPAAANPAASNPAAGDPAATNPVGGNQRTPDPHYASCKEAVAAGDGPYTKGRHPEYSWYKDVDNNGVACNSADLQ
jgi:hypothetical protein